MIYQEGPKCNGFISYVVISILQNSVTRHSLKCFPSNYLSCRHEPENPGATFDRGVALAKVVEKRSPPNCVEFRYVFGKQ